MWWSERPLSGTRRRLLSALGALAVPALPGCGFALRQAPALPFERIALVGFAPRSPLALELGAGLAAAAQVVDAPAQAQVLLQAISDRRERSVVASTAAGQVRELQLRLRFEFRLTSPGGRELIPPTELMAQRDMSYSETFALAKAQEEAELMAAMQSDIVQQVLRRLARATPGVAAVAPARPAASAPR
jgi:LPS-assembly lipoprotein